MENFTFFNPVKLHFGKGQIAKIGKEIATSGLRKVLIVAGGGSIKNNGVYDQVTESLKENNIAWAEYWGVSPNPTLTQAKAGIEALRNNCCQAVLAVGGGSVIDLSKAIVAGVYFDDIWDAYQFGSSITKALPLFTVLTISAAGSEMNTNSVLTNEKSNLKLAIHSPVLFPKCSIIDPSVQFSLPWKETVNGGVDSLSHIFEVYFSGTDQETTLSISEGLMNSIILSVDKLQTDGNDYSSRANLAWASTAALNGITKPGLAGEWAVHSIEHGISGLFPRVAHAEGLAVLTPAWIKYVHNNAPHIFDRWAKKIWNVSSIDEAICALIAKLKQWGAPTSMNDLNILNNDFEKIAELSISEGIPGKIKPLYKEDIINILKLTNEL